LLTIILFRSSGIQVLPAIHDQASKITTFIRSPTWVSPVQAQEQHVYSEEERRVFAEDPQALLKYRKELEAGFSALWPMFIADSEVQKATFGGMTMMMKDKLRNEGLEELVIPQWAVGCRRITPGVGYLETLGSEKVEVVFGEIQKITEKGCVGGDGKEHPVDVLICATGFDTSYRPRFPIIGPSGQTLSDVWAEEAKSYLGIAAHGYPNYFMIGGPNSPVGNGPVLAALGEFFTTGR
jgi:cation diffusion facilitator CzcD-associated flavoprotein CzcO